MKKLILLLVAVTFLMSMFACSKKEEKEPVTLFPQGSENDSQTEDAPTVKVNDTYEKVLFEITEVDSSQKVQVVDNSLDYRTTDSYRYEKTATDEAVRKLSEATEKYSSVKIEGINVFDCMDDGESVYYSFSISHSYTVESGGRINNIFYCDVGVKKSDETVFDASDIVFNVKNGYSVFVKRTEKNSTDEVLCDGEDESIKEAVKAFATKRLKKPEIARIFSVTEIENGIYEVICSGENSYGHHIKDSMQIGVEYIEDDGILKLSL